MNLSDIKNYITNEIKSTDTCVEKAIFTMIQNPSINKKERIEVFTLLKEHRPNVGLSVNEKIQMTAEEMKDHAWVLPMG